MSENLEEYTNKVIEEFEAVSKDAERVQRETLKSILEDNASAEYLLSLGLNGRTDPESFKACVPLVTHEDLEPYINRILAGEKSSILTRKPITHMAFSSGTTQGKSKYIPWDPDSIMVHSKLIFHTAFAFRNRAFPIKNGKVLSFSYRKNPTENEAGIKVATATALVTGDEQYTPIMAAINSQVCSPQEVTLCPDFEQGLYCHLLCGLIFRDQIQFLYTPFAHSLVNAFRTLEQVWEELCNDLREGVLSSRVTDPSVRTAMSKILKPDPELANLIHKICTGLNNWYGVVQELFPNAKYLLGIMTGTMLPYVERLRHYAGEVPVLTSDYGASEGWIAVNVHPTVPPELASYTMLPQIGYFEFLPLAQNSIAKPVGLTEVKVGEEYEIVMTTPAGLYRYKVGDVVKVTGFYNSTPEFNFVRRSNLLLSINVDKNTENDLYISVMAASKVLAKEKLDVIDFTSHVDLSIEPGHYVIFLEISGEASEEVLSECCNCLDKSFIEAGYVTNRAINLIGPLELRVVRRGTFHKILESSVGRGAAVSQFKTPRCVPSTNTQVMQILTENVEKKYSSTHYN
ncbi:hypothetical protein TanjilG_11219 [Lupinus angustifolius]|uniref:Uncharacterized protein n=1 Tax=Lupinus angustifolius TaxID=3871 RepID=A0A1J7HKQ9_LUPAN|nr:PREDICTED: jasmonic acid-amido synthetase JAR1-like [Lupinus angustifolius]OIW02325.1 hypothetical protein TanjilG_11219 [Lupinus angustifolius]